MVKEGIPTQVRLLLPLLALTVNLVLILIVAQGSSGWIPVRSDYHKSITECLTKDEFKLEMEVTHRILTRSAITPFPSLEMKRV
ncbi:hypothetical protein MUK42_34953 [Musa troglodytarum]|uniref:Uncharacterized protein n=1 Tax=Musa troglodytarum TaxID=320322 RepID=A0A9E7EPH2_9LILI|nr:hypothetical protein MUK42_34953 [Musa troglodytarum]